MTIPILIDITNTDEIPIPTYLIPVIPIPTDITDDADTDADDTDTDADL